jgi:predicted dehydrogenase
MIGEGCHWLDLLAFLAGAPITSARSLLVGDNAGLPIRTDHCGASLAFADGSVANFQYFANGHRSFPKERLTVFVDGKILELDNFRVLQGYGWSRFGRLKTFRQDKGHQAEIAALVDRIAQGGEPIMDFQELVNVTEASFLCDASEMMPAARPVELAPL